DMSTLVEPSGLLFKEDRTYETDELDRIFQETQPVSAYIGSIVIRRALWMARERQRYFGSGLIHLGVIFQQRLPSRTLVIATPLVGYRCGVQASEAQAEKLLSYASVGYPYIIESSALSEPLKKRLVGNDFLSSAVRFLRWRASGFYSITDYRRLRRQSVVSD